MTVTRPLALAALCAATVSGTAALAQARATCAARDNIIERLSNSYGETRQSVGLGANNALVEVFASDKTGTWTITVTMPDGTTCLLASGDAFEALVDDKLVLPGKGA